APFVERSNVRGSWFAFRSSRWRGANPLAASRSLLAGLGGGGGRRLLHWRWRRRRSPLAARRSLLAGWGGGGGLRRWRRRRGPLAARGSLLAGWGGGGGFRASRDPRHNRIHGDSLSFLHQDPGKSA